MRVQTVLWRIQTWFHGNFSFSKMRKTQILRSKRDWLCILIRAGFMSFSLYRRYWMGLLTVPSVQSKYSWEMGWGVNEKREARKRPPKYSMGWNKSQEAWTTHWIDCFKALDKNKIDRRRKSYTTAPLWPSTPMLQWLSIELLRKQMIFFSDCLYKVKPEPNPR